MQATIFILKAWKKAPAEGVETSTECFGGDVRSESRSKCSLDYSTYAKRVRAAMHVRLNSRQGC